MSALAPCPSCARHVRRHETTCPFCSAVISLGPAPTPRVISQRLSRAAMLTVGAAIVTSTGCGTAVAAYGAPAPDTGAPAADAGRDAAQAVDAGEDAGQPMTLYGGPILNDAGP